MYERYCFFLFGPTHKIINLKVQIILSKDTFQYYISGRTHQLQPGGPQQVWLPGANDDDHQSDSTDTSDDDCYSLDEEEKSLPEHRFEKR